MGVVIVFIALFATVFGILYVFNGNRNKERLALIEKGADASLFNIGPKGVQVPYNWGKLGLKIGMFMIGIGIGIIFGNILAIAGYLEEEVSYFSMILFFGGLSLVLFYIFDRKK